VMQHETHGLDGIVRHRKSFDGEILIAKGAAGEQRAASQSAARLPRFAASLQ